MSFLEKLKSIFFKKKTKYITSGIDVDKILQLAKKEKDPEKKLNILRNYCYELPSSEITQIVLTLPQNKRVEGIEIAQKYITPYDLYDIASKKLDYKGKLSVLEKFPYRLDLEDIFGLFNSIPPDQRNTALKKCIDRFDSFGISEIVKKYIPLYEKLDCLNLYHNQLDSSSKASIISSLDPERKIRALTQYGKELNKTDLEDIVCNTESTKISEVFDVVYSYLTPVQIENMIQYYIPENQKLSALYKSCNKLSSATISDIIKFSIPENQKEEALVSLQNRIASNNIGEIIQFCIKGKNILDKVRNNLDEEDIDYFTKMG